MNKRFTVPVAILAVILPFLIFAQGTWTQRSSMLGAARSNLLGFALNGKGYIAGGTSGGLSGTNDCQQYDPVTNTWTEKSPMPVPFRAGACFAADEYGYTTTGVNEAMFIQQLFEYNPYGDNWAEISYFPGEVRMYASGFGIGRNGFITCGSYINLYPLNDLWQYDQLANTWSQKANLPATPRSNAASFASSSKGYLFGGIDEANVLNELWQYEPATDTWTQKTSLPGNGRTDAMAFVIGDYGYIIGGYVGQGATSEVWRYDMINDSWLQLDDFPGIAPASGAAFAIGGLGYVVGGYGTSQCWEFDPTGVGIQVQENLAVSVYPNPADSKLFVSVDESYPDDLRIILLDVTGKLVFSKDYIGMNEVEVDLGHLLPGLYLIQIQTDNVMYTEKIFLR